MLALCILITLCGAVLARETLVNKSRFWLPIPMISWDGEAVLERGIRHLPGWAIGEITPSALAMLSGAYLQPASASSSGQASASGSTSLGQASANTRQYYEMGKSWCSGAMVECRCERGGRIANARILTTTATEVMYMMMEYLDMKDYGLLARVCKSTATICKENMHYWRKIIHKFGYSTHLHAFVAILSLPKCAALC